MSEPRNTIDGLLKEMKAPCFKTNDITSVVRREELLERAIETLIACEAIQQELQIQIGRSNNAGADLHQRLANVIAENAILRRRLEVATSPDHDVTLHYRYVSKKWKDKQEKHLKDGQAKAESRPDSAKEHAADLLVVQAGGKAKRNHKKKAS